MAGLRDNAPTLLMWRFFVAAVESGSMLRVAEIFRTDVSVVSRELSRLEKIVDEPLLERSRRGVKPTWSGAMRYRQAASVVKKFDQLLVSCKYETASEQAALRVAVPNSLSSLFVSWIAQFGAMTAHRDVTVEVQSYSDNAPPDVTQFDLYVCKRTLPNIRVIAHLLGSIERVIVASPDFLKTQRPVCVPEDLSDRQLIGERNGRVLMLGNGQSVAIWVNCSVRVSEASALVAPALAGAGYAVGAPLWQVEKYLERGELSLVLPQWRIASCNVWILRSPNGKKAAQQRLLTWLMEQWGKVPGVLRSARQSSLNTNNLFAESI